MMLNTVYNTLNIGGLCNPQEVLTEANYLVKIEMVDGSSQLVQISKEQATALGIEFSEAAEMQSEVINVENVGAANSNPIQLKIVPAKTQYNYKVIQPEDLNLRPNLPVPALALPRGRPKKRTPSDHIETKQEPPPKIIKRARTRCGRISRPPVHMEKVFKLVSNEDNPIEQKTTSKPTQTENPIIPSEPPPLILKKIEKHEPPVAPPQPAKKKRVISAQYRCSTCHKAYLGRNRMAQHLKKHPDHRLNSDFNLDDNEAWECLIETALKAKEGQKGNKFCNEFVTLVKNARTLAKYFFKPAKIGKAEYHVDDFLSGLLNLKVGDYRFNENELCKDVSIFSFLEYFDDNFITTDVKQKPENHKPNDVNKIKTNEIDATLRSMHFLNEKINETAQNKQISLSEELNDLLKANKIDINKTTEELNKINSLSDKINKLESSFSIKDEIKLVSNFAVNNELNKINSSFQIEKNNFPVNDELQKIHLLDSELNKMEPFLNKTNNNSDTFIPIDYLNKSDKLNYENEKIEKQNEETLKTSANVDLHFGSEIIDVIQSASPKNTAESGKEIHFVESNFFSGIYPQNKETKQSDYTDLFMYSVDKRNENEDKNNFTNAFDSKEAKNKNNFGKLQYDKKVNKINVKKWNKHDLTLFDENNVNKNDFGNLFEEKNKGNKNNFRELFEEKDKLSNNDFRDLFEDKSKPKKNDFCELFEEKNKLNKNNFGDLFEEKNKNSKSLFEDENKTNKNEYVDLFEEKNKSNKNDFGDLFEVKNKTNKNNFSGLYEAKNKSNKNDFGDLFKEKEQRSKNDLRDLFEDKNKSNKNDFVDLFEEKGKINKNDFTDLLFDPHMSLNLLSSPQKTINKDKIEVGNFNLNLLNTPEKPADVKKLNYPKCAKEIICLESSGIEVSNFNLNLLSTPDKNSSENGVKNLENSKEIIEAGNFNLNLLSTPDKNPVGCEVKNVRVQNTKEIMDAIQVKYDSFLTGKKDIVEDKYDSFLSGKKDLAEVKYENFLSGKKDVVEVKYDSFLSGKKDKNLDFSEKSGTVEEMDLHKLHLLSDELILPVGGVGVGILDTSTNSDDIMNVDQFVNERFKKLTGAVDEVMSGLEMPHLDCFNFHPS